MRLPGFPHQKNLAGPHMVRFWENKSLAPYESNALRAKLSAAEKNCAPKADSKPFATFTGGLSLPPDMGRGYPEGQRHLELTKRAGWCVGPGGRMNEAEAVAACLAWNEFNMPPLRGEEILGTVASIARKEAQKRAANDRGLPIIRVEGGELSRAADDAEQALIRFRFPIFVRAGALVSPVTETVPAAKGRTTIVARLRRLGVDVIIDWLSQCADFRRYDGRVKKWVSVDPPERVAKIILERAGVGKFPQVAGVITTPTLRPDGLVVAEPGYDGPTRLYLTLDPQFTMPLIPDAPTHVDALEAVALLGDLLSGFPFVSPVDRAVALSGILTAVLRGALSVSPMHVFRAHTAGTGKSLLVDVAAAIATGRRCPVIAAGKSEEETEKRLGALLRDGVSVVSIDNVSGELGGDALAQMTERPLVRMRILGKSEAPEFECKAAMFATGNNLVLVGDMVRRAVICTLDASVERPELREFQFDPIDRILQNRGAYVAAGLTVVRAYRAAGAPKVCGPLGSYGEWSETVRAPLIWLGEADPIRSDSMEIAREEDPELAAIRELFAMWRKHARERETWTASELIKVACSRPNGVDFKFSELRDLLLRVAGEGGAVSGKRLGKWLSRISGRVVDGLRLEMKRDASHGNRFLLRPVFSSS
jgi:putative DNA primase/helicase